MKYRFVDEVDDEELVPVDDDEGVLIRNPDMDFFAESPEAGLSASVETIFNVVESLFTGLSSSLDDGSTFTEMELSVILVCFEITTDSFDCFCCSSCCSCFNAERIRFFGAAIIDGDGCITFIDGVPE